MGMVLAKNKKMKIIAKIQIRENEKHHWMLKDNAIWEKCLDNLCQAEVIDYIFIWTDDKKIKELITSYNDVWIFDRPKDMIHYGNSLNTINDWHNIFENHIRKHLGNDYNDIAIIFHININLALITPDTWKKMYHKLMENDKANGIFPVVKVKPHLYMLNPMTGFVFPILEQPGLDRQKYPQLYRKLGSWIEHTKRLKIAGIYNVLWHEIPQREAIDIETKEDLEMAQYFAKRRHK
jgi:CMP-N-acetylneuraminic acid synthetase